VRYAYATISALLLGGATATLALQPSLAQTAQNEPGAIAASAPRAGAPMSFADMVAKLQPAVVNISTKQSIQLPRQNANPFAGTPFEQFFQQGQGGGGGAQPQRREGQSLGSGFIISADGYIVTNNHVVAPARGATVESITVTLDNRREFTAKLIGRDERSDLAVLKIEAAGLPFVRFGDSARARVGDWIVAIGQPFGLGGTVTAGIVSAVHRVPGIGAERFIQTDAAINQGNSGGPMFNLNGDVIGVNSQIYSQSGGNIGIGFAIPAEDAKPIVDTLMKGQRVQRGYLGVTLGGQVDADAAQALGIQSGRGELLAGVTPGGPAARAGLRAGDVVLRVNGQQVDPDNTLTRLVAGVAPGQSARLEYIRGGRTATANVTVDARPTEEQLAATLGQGDDFSSDDEDQPGTPTPAGNALGLVVQPLTPTIARQVGVDSTVQGVVVAQVDPASDAAGKLRRADVIQSVNGTPVRTAAELTQVVAAAKTAGRPQVLLLVQRGRQPAGFVTVRLKG
jgi:serine protease Do